MMAARAWGKIVLGMLACLAICLPPCAGADIACRPGESGSTTTLLGEGGASVAVLSSFDRANGSGALRLVPATDNARGAFNFAATTAWDAGAILTGRPDAHPPVLPRPAAAQRKIFTLAYRSGATVPFKWESLPPELRASLDRAPEPAAANDGLGAARTAFLRGERANERGSFSGSGIFRHRVSVLGDIVHSKPILVAAPSPALHGTNYSTFLARYANRPAAIYVGANDGMLHAFDLRDGSELFAYIPSAVFAALNLLSAPNYAAPSYVDGSPAAAEALLDGQWRTVLVSGMGQGARGVFAIDITDPGAFDGGRGALWEFGERDDSAIGPIDTPPRIVKLRTAADAFGYFAAVTSGPVLFLLALDKAPAQAWRLGRNYFKLTIPASGGQAALGAPSFAVSADGLARDGYAGDAAGRLWRFDLSGGAPWTNAAGIGRSRSPLFVAHDGNGRPQTITQAPLIAIGPGGGYLLLFGAGGAANTGGLGVPAGAADSAAAAPQAAASFYAVRDADAAALALPLARADLAQRALTNAGANGGAPVISGADLDYGAAAHKQGWYFDFPQTGPDLERSVGATLLSGTLVIDSEVPAREACGAALARTYVLDALSGLARGADARPHSGAAAGWREPGAALAGTPLVLTRTTAAVRSSAGDVRVVRSYAIATAGSDGMPRLGGAFEVSVPAGRLGWRELVNWQELHDAAAR
ncbi:MAG: PilC/PilY family type IV pilus protein [Pseudomonadota bacterium]